MLASIPRAATWEPLPPLPEPNGGFTCAVWQDHLVVIGGTQWVNDEKRWIDRVNIFNPATSRWSAGERLPHAAAHQVVGLHNADLVIGGGTTGSATFLGLWTFSAGRRHDWPAWLPAGHGTAGAAGGVIGREMILVGGTDDIAQFSRLTSRVITLALPAAGPSTSARPTLPRPLPDYPSGPVGLAASVVQGDRLLVFGGASWNGEKILNLSAANILEVRAGTWRALRPLPKASRGITGVALDEDRIYLAGGFQDGAGFTDDAVIYHVREDRYSPAIPLPYAAFVGLVRHQDYVYCLGGEDRARHRTDAMHRIRIGDLPR